MEQGGKGDLVRSFRIALTGDFLDDSGGVAYGDAGLGLFAGHPEIRWHFVKGLAPKPGDASYWSRLYSLEVAPEHIRDVDGLIVLRPWVKRSTFAAGAGDLVVIGRSGAGFDKIDLAACTAHGVAVFNASMALNHSTASSALLFMLALAKRLPEQDRVVRQGRWDLQPSVMGGELQGRTLGIVGLGHSGRELVRLVAPFEMPVVAYSPHADPAVARGLGVELTSLEEVLRRSDFVSLHCRLNDATRGLIGAAQLALLKPSAYCINVGRGELVDQAALAAALRQRRIAGAALDVFEVEPLPLDDPLLSLENVILTPHWSASTADVWRATARAMAEGMLRAARGLLPENVVNPEVLEWPAFQEKLGRFAENASHPDRDLDDSNEVE
jgi:phosphoglycerate dehydrogenase-like enzyme